MTREEAIKELKTILKVGDTVYTILRHVSASGMSRAISFVVIKKNEPLFIDNLVEQALDMKGHKTKEGLVVGGCGMDMGFHVVYNLSHAMYDTKRTRRAGYKLNHRWM